MCQIAPMTHDPPRLHMEVQIASVTIGQRWTPQWQQRPYQETPSKVNQTSQSPLFLFCRGFQRFAHFKHLSTSENVVG